jgi:HlyD family secretion protein
LRSRWIPAAIVVVVAAVGAFLLTRHKEKPPEYRTATVERGSIVSTISATGTVNPVRMVQVGSQVSGTIQFLFADFNSRVKKNEVVAQLDPSFYRTQLAQAEASLARAQVDVADAERTWKRSLELLDRKLMSQAEVDAAEATRDRARAGVKQADASVAQARVNLEHTTIASPIDGVVVGRNVDVGQTVAASLQAPVLFQIANDLTAMQVEASIDEADIGQIQAGQPVHFTVDAYPDEKFLGTVSQIRLQPVTVQNVVTYTTVIAVSNPDLKLRPGMTANVSVEVARRDEVLKVPSGALSFKMPPAKADRSSGASRGMAAGSAGSTRPAGAPGAAGSTGRGAGAGQGRRAGGGAAAGAATGGEARRPPGQTVWVMNGGGAPQSARITTGITDGYFTELVEGPLKEGDQVVTGIAGAGQAQFGDRDRGTTKNPLAGGRRF